MISLHHYHVESDFAKSHLMLEWVSITYFQVVFTREVVPFASIQTRNMHYERRYAIFFENEGVMRAYDFLLEHRCKACDDMPVFRNFTQLKDHMRKYHERFYCELCVDHLKVSIFSDWNLVLYDNISKCLSYLMYVVGLIRDCHILRLWLMWCLVAWNGWHWQLLSTLFATS